MHFTRLKRLLRLDRLRLQGPDGARDESLMAATDQTILNLANMRPARI